MSLEDLRAEADEIENLIETVEVHDCPGIVRGLEILAKRVTKALRVRELELLGMMLGALVLIIPRALFQ